MTAIVAVIFGRQLASDGATIVYATDEELLRSAGIRLPRVDVTFCVGAASRVDGIQERYVISYEVSRAGNPRTLRFDGECVRSLDADAAQNLGSYVWLFSCRLAKTIL